jgi:hypothetical protein
MQPEQTMQPGPLCQKTILREEAQQATRSTYAKHRTALEMFSRSLKGSQVEHEWRRRPSQRPSLGAKTMQPDPETRMMRPEEALKALEMISRSIEKGQVETGLAAASSKGPSRRPSWKDDAHEEQRPRLTRSSSEDAGFVRALRHSAPENLSENRSSGSVAGTGTHLTLTRSRSNDLDMYMMHNRFATSISPAHKVVFSVPLLYFDSPRNTQLEKKLTL